jgi:ELP3 family radical SAM enzyme/protein acetyltransferase
MNITRVQIGVQHFDDDVLKYIKRDCYLKDTINATYLLKQNGYKIDMHLMPDLPGSSFEKDMNMFQKLFSHKVQKVSEHYYKYTLDYPDIQPDQLKIYPCSTVPFTEIKEWYDNGSYKPYSENKDKLIELILYIKQNVYPWIRLNRVIRDIPLNWIDGGNKDVSLRQHILNYMKQNNIKSNCIRAREVNHRDTDISKAIKVTREYNGNKGKEYFISYESSDYSIIYGFIRLRINFTNDDLFNKNLNNSAFIRELHVYGSLCKHNEKGKNIQHQGFGKKLLKSAEYIVKYHNIEKINIISGVGVRQYYEKFGYKLNNKTNYMFKKLNYIDNTNINNDNKKLEFIIIMIINLIIINLLSYYYYYNINNIIEIYYKS